MKLVICLFVSVVVLEGVAGHGMLMDPPSRNSMWRVGFNTPKNYDDMGLNCGGFANQWNNFGGKCGLCGDPYDKERKHEAGGMFAPVNRPITECYNANARTIPVNVRVTAYHKGYFEFRLCVNNDLSRDAIDCLDGGILMTIADTDGQTRYDINGFKQDSYQLELDMPDVLCTQCILHWKYNTGNSYGCDEDDCAIGRGPQEQFINCADISILNDCSGSPTADPGVTQAPPITNGPSYVTTQEPDVTTAAPYTTTERDDDDDEGGDGNGDDLICFASEVYSAVPDMDEWCMVNCNHPEYPYCPSSHCVCYYD